MILNNSIFVVVVDIEKLCCSIDSLQNSGHSDNTICLLVQLIFEKLIVM